MTPTPPGALPVLNESLLLRIPAGIAIAIITTFVMATVWATTLYLRISSIDNRLSRVEHAMGISIDEPKPKPTTRREQP